LDSTFNEALCLQGKTLICPTGSSIIIEPTSNCLFHLISGSLHIGKEESKCELTEIRTGELYLQSIDVEEWAVSTPEPVSIEPICIDLNDTDTPTISYPAISVQGDVILSIPRQCTVTIGSHIIPTRLLMTEDLGRITNKIITPSIHTHQLLELHGLQLIEDKVDEEINGIFKDMIEYHHKKALTINSTTHEIKELLKQMMDKAHEVEQMKPVIEYHAISWSTIVIIGIVVIGIIIWIRRRPQRTPRMVTKTVQGSKSQDVEMQVRASKRLAPQPPKGEETEAL
jgi:hypothetical protein